MRYRELSIQTEREMPANVRAPGQAWLLRANYFSRSGEPLPLGQRSLERLQALAARESGAAFFDSLELPVLVAADEFFFSQPSGELELVHCPGCGFTARRERAPSRKSALPAQEPAPLEKIRTPECSSIEALAAFLRVPKEMTAKALMFTRLSDGKFIFAVVRGDGTLSEAKLAQAVGALRKATDEEIATCGAVPGYASPLGVRNALVVVDDLIPQSANLVAGANEHGYHLKNVNYGRDYRAELVTDLILPAAGDGCPLCGAALQISPADLLAAGIAFRFDAILRALAEVFHDQKGLRLPAAVAPFDVYLLWLPGKTVDTASAADGLYADLSAAGLTVLYDDRDERAGVKFNDADLIGCPLRLTVGERGLQNGMVELKSRMESESQAVSLSHVVEWIKNR